MRLLDIQGKDSSLGHFVYLMHFARLMGVNPVISIQC
jgi:hypothetical protein